MQRAIGIVVLFVTGMLSLPVSASLFDGQGTENLILPLQLLGMAAIGAGLAVWLPALARHGASTARRAMTGASWGVLAAVVGLLLFFFELTGFSGA